MLQPTPQKTVTTRKTHRTTKTPQQHTPQTHTTNTALTVKNTPRHPIKDTQQQHYRPVRHAAGRRKTTKKTGGHKTHTGAVATHPHPPTKQTHNEPLKKPQHNPKRIDPSRPNPIRNNQPTSQKNRQVQPTQLTQLTQLVQSNPILLNQPTPCSVVVGLAAGGVAPPHGAALNIFAPLSWCGGLALFSDEGFHRHRTLTPVADAYRVTVPPCPNLPASVDG